MYFLFKNSRIALSSPTKLTDEMTELTLPAGYSTANQCDWKLIDGELVYDPIPRPLPRQTQDERITALETQFAAYEEAYTQGVNEA